ncbi:MAG: hypothetical protein HC836_41855 [Richelia sp. RM2_1_2]|nr:hypothetical protein [Richelia sp. RM2_1_2]
METTNYKTDIINVDDTVVFTNKIIETFVKIDAFATKNNYICNIKYHSDFVTASNVQGGLTNLSRTQKKVLRNLIHGLDKKNHFEKSQQIFTSRYEGGIKIRTENQVPNFIQGTGD